MASGMEKTIQEISHLLDQVKKDSDAKTNEKDLEIERLKEEIEKQKDMIYKLQMGSDWEEYVDDSESKKDPKKTDRKTLEEENANLRLRNCRLFHENHDLDCLRGLDHCEIERLKKENEKKEAMIEEKREQIKYLLVTIAEQDLKLKDAVPPEEVEKIKEQLRTYTAAYELAFKRLNEFRDMLSNSETHKPTLLFYHRFKAVYTMTKKITNM